MLAALQQAIMVRADLHSNTVKYYVKSFDADKLREYVQMVLEFKFATTFAY